MLDIADIDIENIKMHNFKYYVFKIVVSGCVENDEVDEINTTVDIELINTLSNNLIVVYEKGHRFYIDELDDIDYINYNQYETIETLEIAYIFQIKNDICYETSVDLEYDYDKNELRFGGPCRTDSCVRLNKDEIIMFKD